MKNQIVSNQRVDADHIAIDDKNVRTFWDVERSSMIVTQSDFEKLDFSQLEPEDIMNRVPVGTGYDVVMRLLIGQICKLSKKVQNLELELADRVILDPSYDSKPNR